MPSPVTCPSCGERLDIPADLRGTPVRCAACSNVFAPPPAGDEAPAVRVAAPAPEPLPDDEYADDRDWNYNVRAGGVLPVTDNIEVGAGVFTDRSPHRNTPVDFYGGTVGIRVGQDHAVDGARQLTFATTLAGRYAYGSGEMQGARVPTEAVDDWGPTSVRVRYHEMSLVIGGTVYF